MKNMLFTTAFAVAALSSPAIAQIEAGYFRVGAGLAALSYSDLNADGADIQETRFAITPGGAVRAGYAVTELVELGLDLDVEYRKLEVAGVDDDGWQLGVGPYGALNFALNDFGTLVMGPSLALRYRHLDGDDLDIDAFQLVVGGEVKAFVARNASIDFGIFFAYIVGEGDVG